jgi:hypothetical protein
LRGVWDDVMSTGNVQDHEFIDDDTIDGLDVSVTLAETQDTPTV